MHAPMIENRQRTISVIIARTICSIVSGPILNDHQTVGDGGTKEPNGRGCVIRIEDAALMILIESPATRVYLMTFIRSEECNNEPGA